MTESPRIIVQSDWEEALRGSNSSAWVSYRRPGDAAVHGELHSRGFSNTSSDACVSGSPGFTVDKASGQELRISYSGASACTYTFTPPTVAFSTVHKPKTKVQCLDVTAGGLAVSSDSQCKTYVWTTGVGEVRRELVGHHGDVYTCRFFPSGVVILTGGSDMRLKIWAAETGQCAATLVGHTAGILDSAVVDRGRNVVSCGRDGTIRLWDCGSQSCIRTFTDIGGIVNSCALQDTPPDIALGIPHNPPSEKECGTEGKLVLAACENGHLRGYGLASKECVLDVGCESAVNCVSWLSDVRVVCGTEDGHFYSWDIRNTNHPMHHHKYNRGSILSCMPYRAGAVLSTSDGSCCLLDQNLSCNVELTGSDCDPVYGVAQDNRYVYTACRDGIIRKYRNIDVAASH